MCEYHNRLLVTNILENKMILLKNGTYTNKVRVILPDRLGVDWNDLLLENLIDRYL